MNVYVDEQILRPFLHEGRVTLALGLTLLFLVSQGERNKRLGPSTRITLHFTTCKQGPRRNMYKCRRTDKNVFEEVDL
jgi:hypothetical protein